MYSLAVKISLIYCYNFYNNKKKYVVNAAQYRNLAWAKTPNIECDFKEKKNISKLKLYFWLKI